MPTRSQIITPESFNLQTQKELVLAMPAGVADKFVEAQLRIHQKTKKPGQGLLAFCLLRALGCTPTELERGIQLKGLNADEIAVEIPNLQHAAKSTQNNASRRVFKLIGLNKNLATKLLQHYFCHPMRLGKSSEVSIKANRVEKKMRELNRQLSPSWPKRLRETSLTPGFFRHLLIAELVQSRLYTFDEISTITGIIDKRALQNTYPHKCKEVKAKVKFIVPFRQAQEDAK